MRVILCQDVKNLGQKGDVVKVADGYARNYLIPKGLAVEATQGKLKELQRQRQAESEKRRREEEEARKLAARLEDLKVQLRVKTGDLGKIFGAVSNKDIAEALVRDHQISIDKKKVLLEEPIKTPGRYRVELKLHPSVRTHISVEVLPED